MPIETTHSPPPVTAPSFGPVHILEPQSRHTHTAILLHGRGSTGKEFAEELFESRLFSGKSLQEHLPGWRWVFPSSRELWSTAFQEAMPAWFEAHSLTDATARQDLQMDGIRESVRHLTGVLDQEIARLGGAADRVVLGGVSQGGAIGLWTLLCACGDNPSRRLGAFLGTSTWLPFAENLRCYLGGGSKANLEGASTARDDIENARADAFLQSMTAPLKRAIQAQGRSRLPFFSIPVFLGHGTDDAYVDIELGRQVAQVLTEIGLKIEWHEYSGADQEGHWLKEPDEFDDIVRFLTSALGGNE
ncbi:hypothetical protein VTK56DRAFT_5420 [Thermocarpiscus australiensis]